MTLFSGKYDVYGSRPNQINLAAELEAQGVANHTVAGTISSIFVAGAVSLALGGGLDRLSTGISNVKNIFQTVFNNNDEEDYFAGLGGSAPAEEESIDVDKTTNTIKNFNTYLDRYNNATTKTEKSLCAGAIKGFYEEYVKNGGNDQSIIKKFKDIEKVLDNDLNNLGQNLSDYNFFS